MANVGIAVAAVAATSIASARPVAGVLDRGEAEYHSPARFATGATERELDQLAPGLDDS
jgi:hypothetical protein